MKSLAIAVFGFCGWLSVGIPVSFAASTDEAKTISGRVSTLRQLAESARAGEIPPDQVRALRELRIFMTQAVVQTDGASSMQTSNALPMVIAGRAQKEDAIPIDCREIQLRFYLAKAQWGQLLCLADRIVQLSAQPCPDLHCINQLRREAEVLKTRIDALYPLEWDEKTIPFSRSWTFDPRIYGAQLDAFLGKQNVLAGNPKLLLQFTNFASLKWRDSYWQDLANVPFTRFVVSDSKVEVDQMLSVTNYCLESIRMDLALKAHVSGFETRDFGVYLQF